ncbi:LysR substrate-binding domain-containing protein [Neptunicella sp. SCSIO 80796]|uniref:LysR substrate-binding domain-containing protein n=1 Tax=Neptunicella plasticusilytica TaxID=3117012 RepID=UPI003A4D1FE7
MVILRSLPPLKSLQVFLAAAQQGSFKLAAEQLFVTQAAVSQQIRLLEQHLNCTLFDRLGKQTRLTAQGRLLLPHIEQAFQHMLHGVSAITGDPNPNILRITSLHSFTSLWLIPKIVDFQQQNPDLVVQFSPSNQLASFQQTEVDIAIRKGQGHYPGLTVRKLLDDQILLVASPMLVGETPLSAQQLFALPLLEDISSDTQEALQFCCQQFQLDRQAIYSLLRADDSVSIIENALAGRGIALVNSVLVREHIRQQKLVSLLDFSHASHLAMYLVAPEQHFSWNKVQRFEQWFIEKLQAD